MVEVVGVAGLMLRSNLLLDECARVSLSLSLKNLLYIRFVFY
jgi:hypothetical protein